MKSKEAANIMDIMPLLETNVGDRRFRETKKIVLVGSCVINRTDLFLESFKNQPWVSICLEAVHVNHAGFKLAQMIQYSKIQEITVLTVDGSPHCIQAHFLAEDIKTRFVSNLEVKHFVLEKANISQVSSKAVKLARHLSKVEKIIQHQ
ncbi:MAG: 4Fe-4S ferredoxin [Candidatus Hodarchaeota archaeon]